MRDGCHLRIGDDAFGLDAADDRLHELKSQVGVLRDEGETEDAAGITNTSAFACR